MDNNNQLSRYGAIAKALPFHTGKTFFLVNATEFALQEFQNKYPVDSDGVTRIYTTWAGVIAACQTNTDYDTVIVSPLFTTAPSLAQIAQLDAAGAIVMQAGNMLPDGSYLATRAANTLGQTTSQNIFAVNGRVEIINLLGEVTTTIGTSTISVQFLAIPTVGTTVAMCASTSVTSAPVGTQLSITGTLANALVVTTTAGVFVRQAAQLIVTAGNIAVKTDASTTGNVKYRVHYKALDPGAFISAV